MPPPLTLDFVSDVSCPWCAIGLWSLQQAMSSLAGELQFTLRCQPFELNPDMPPGGEDITAHLTRKYGSTPAQQAQIRDRIRERGAAVGFTFSPDGRGRIYNTFDAHRLLHWAGVEHPDHQIALKQALLIACHRDRRAMDDADVLLAAVSAVGLDPLRARTLLKQGTCTQEVRERERFYTQAGIQAVPAVVVNNRHLISGGQPPEVYEQALRDIALAPVD